MMSERRNMNAIAPELLVIITDMTNVKKVTEILSDSLLRFMYTISAEGTARSELLDILGLGNVEKALIMCLLPSFRATEILRNVAEGLNVDLPGNGVAFKIPLSGVISPISRFFDEEHLKKLIEALEPEKKERISEALKNASGNQEFFDWKHAMERMNGNMEIEAERTAADEFSHDLILCVINVGYSDELVDAAREAGATGGTIIHARRTGEDAVKFFGISLQAEKEVVAILAKRETRNSIMKAINNSCGLNSEAAGIVFSVPVGDVAGFGNVTKSE